MKKLMITLIICAVVLTGCGNNGISQEEYEKVLTERDELESKLKKNEIVYELELKYEQYSLVIDEQYRHAKFIIYVAGKVSGIDTNEILEQIESTYDATKSYLSTLHNLYDDLQSTNNNVLDENEVETCQMTIDGIDSAYDSWKNAYDSTLQIEDTLMENNTQSADTQINKEISLASETILYEDEKVRISFAEVNKNGVVFWVENLTDVNITIQADSVSVNGISTNDIMMSDDVAPQSKGKAIAKCDDFSAIMDVETIGGQLRIIDFGRSFNSYSATFANVEIE